MNAARAVSRAGFTLIEILVSLILLSLLVAAVFPVVTQQLGQADAPRLANDLVSVRSGIEAFSANMRTGYPGDLEDLIFAPAYTTDKDVAGADFLNSQNQIDARWSGPYADFTATVSSTASGNLFESGFSAFVDYDLTCFNPASTAATGDAGIGCAAGHFVAVKVTGMDTASFYKVNELFDGSTEAVEADQRNLGKLRCFVSGTGDCSTMYYLAVPFRN